MKILWVKAGGLVPLDTGGKIRSYHILTELARRHEVTVVTFYGAHAGDTHAELKNQFARVECCPIELPPSRSFSEAIAYARSLLSPLPYSILKYYRPGIAKRVRQLVEREGSYDAIVCDFAMAGSVIPWDVSCPKILFTHNVEALIWKRHFQVARNPLWKAVCWREYRAMERAERLYLSLASHVLTVSEFDRKIFSGAIDPEKITVIPTGVDVDFFRPVAGQEEPASLVFTGSMDWMPNEDGVFYFTAEILPRIRQQVPEAMLWVVGRRPSARLRELAMRMQGVHVTGEVEDIRPFVHRAAVYVVPLRVGSGTRLKIFEAMAMGKAVVSTVVGAEGLPVKNRENILLADKPDEFGGLVVDLISNPQTRARLGRSARALVEEKYSWTSVAEAFEAVLRRIRIDSGEQSAIPVSLSQLSR